MEFPIQAAAEVDHRRAPKVGLVIRIEEAFLHCPEAFVRSGLRDPARQSERKELQGYPRMPLDQVQGLTEEQNARQSQIMEEWGLY